MRRSIVIVNLKLQDWAILRQQTFSIDPTGERVFKCGLGYQSLPCNVMPNQRHAAMQECIRGWAFRTTRSYGFSSCALNVKGMIWTGGTDF